MYCSIIVCCLRIATVCDFKLTVRLTVKGSAPPKKTEIPPGRKLSAHLQVSQKKKKMHILHLIFITLFSLSVSLSERNFEDHENLVENLLNWTRDSHNKLMFIERIEKYALFKNPQVTVLHYTRRSTRGRTDHLLNTLRSHSAFSV